MYLMRVSEWKRVEREKKKNISWSEGNFFMLSWALTEIMVKFLYYFIKDDKSIKFQAPVLSF